MCSYDMGLFYVIILCGRIAEFHVPVSFKSKGIFKILTEEGWGQASLVIDPTWRGLPRETADKHFPENKNIRDVTF